MMFSFVWYFYGNHDIMFMCLSFLIISVGSIGELFFHSSTTIFVMKLVVMQIGQRHNLYTGGTF